MRYWLFCVTVVVGLGFHPLANAQPESETPIISMDYSGGRLARQTDAPVLSIFADGRVVMPAVYVHSQYIEEVVPVSMVEGLMRYISKDATFFDLDMERIAKQITTENLRGTRVHAPTIEIMAQFDGKERTIAFRQIETDDPEFHRLVKLRARIERVMAYAQVGGQAGVKRLLGDVNVELHRKSAAAPDFNPEDLVAGKRRADGTVYAKFAQIDSKGEIISSTIRIMPSGERRIGVGEVR